jgi:hypothetical protein
MCGRFVRRSTQEVLADWFGAELEEMPGFTPSFNVAPQSVQPAVLVLQLLHLPDLVGVQPNVLLLPAVKRLLTDPTFRISSATGTPISACFNTPTICSTEKRFFFIGKFLRPSGLGYGRRQTFSMVQK